MQSRPVVPSSTPRGPALLGVVCILLFSLTASWDQAAIGGVKPRMIFLLLGLVLLSGVALRHRPRFPWWIHVYGISAIAVTALQLALPVSANYMLTRYGSSLTGQSLGTRPGTLVSLGSLLFNNYAVPLAIVLACLCVPQALRWLVAAYVSGTALSSIAGFLGYEGHPQLLKLLVTPPAPGIRALGFTSHPLHLATSVVFATGLSVWLVVQGPVRWRLVGAFSLAGVFLGLYASGSRGAVIGSAAAVALCVPLLPEVRRRLAVIVPGVTIVLVSVLLVFPDLVPRILHATRLSGGSSVEVSNAGRSELLATGWADFKESPIFGIGVRFLAEAHILFVGVLASGGLILFVAFMLFQYGSLRAGQRSRLADRSLGGALLATMIASLAYWTVGDDFQVASVQIIYGLVWALRLRVPEEDLGTEVQGAGADDSRPLTGDGTPT